MGQARLGFAPEFGIASRSKTQMLELPCTDPYAPWQWLVGDRRPYADPMRSLADILAASREDSLPPNGHRAIPRAERHWLHTGILGPGLVHCQAENVGPRVVAGYIKVKFTSGDLPKIKVGGQNAFSWFQRGSAPVCERIVVSQFIEQGLIEQGLIDIAAHLIYDSFIHGCSAVDDGLLRFFFWRSG